MSINYVNKASRKRQREAGRKERERKKASERGRGRSGTSVNEGKQLEQVLRASAYKYSS